jgi:hypothetical protein
MRLHGLNELKVRGAKWWPTLSRYLTEPKKKNIPLTAHQQFLEKLTFGFWQEYSGISHATFQGLLPIGNFLAPQDLPHELRPVIEDRVDLLISIHVPRVAAILLCTLTEIQAYFHFDGARINQRLRQIWDALLVVPEIKDLYDQRYTKLMHDNGINP